MQASEKILPTHIVSAGGIVRNSSGDILMINGRRGWEFPGGVIENGENLIEGLKREIWEETGAQVSIDELFCVSSNTNEYEGYNGVKTIPTKVILDFICTYEGGTLRASEENTETVFVPEKEASAMITDSVIAERFRAYLEYSGRPAYLAYISKPDFICDVKRTV